MDFHAALVQATESKVATILALQIHGRSIEVYRPRFSQHDGCCKVEYREGLLFQNGYQQDLLNQDQVPGDARGLDFFVAPLSEDELDTVLNEEGEVLLHRLLDGSPDPQRCLNARDKAAFTSWCITALAKRNG